MDKKEHKKRIKYNAESLKLIVLIILGSFMNDIS